MDYQVLARKWRPQSFNDLVGQEHVVKTLGNAFNNQRLHHAYLFTGTHGIGKTTIARIIAKCLNCEQGISDQPCGKCSHCTAIAAGNYPDLIEVDAASRTKVEDTRDLLENVQYAPTQGRYKIYLIDEVHMLSNHSFNALLKTLEEPPAHVIFLLATTDPQKLPVTVLSRCLQFHLKCLSAEQIQQQLTHILDEEKITAETSALTLLAQAANGSMRDALSLTDQAISFGNEALLTDDVRSMLGTIDENQIYQLLEALIQQDGEAILTVIENLSRDGADYQQVLADFISLLHQIAMRQQIPSYKPILASHTEKLTAFTEQLTPEDTQLFYQIALIGRRDLPLAPYAKAGFEMIMLRMLAFQPKTFDSSTMHPSSAEKKNFAHLKEVTQA